MCSKYKYLEEQYEEEAQEKLLWWGRGHFWRRGIWVEPCKPESGYDKAQGRAAQGNKHQTLRFEAEVCIVDREQKAGSVAGGV
jgi:hypothetical protein